MVYRINNRLARRLWLNCQQLATNPVGRHDLSELIESLGYVQLDTIAHVVRAHHHILWSRSQSYREPGLDRLLRTERSVFEHFTHDASILPVTFYPYWTRQFDRQRKRIRNSGWYKSMPDARGRRAIRERIRNEGPLCSADFKSKKTVKREMWERPPHKLALDFMWFAGELATTYRNGFTKYYDLTERVIPETYRETSVTRDEQVDWLCREALNRLGFASAGDIQRFWDAVDLQEAKDWLANNASEIVETEIQTSDRKWVRAFAPVDIEDRVAALKPATSRLRVLNPFDPLIRNRQRLQHLFGFDYRIEIFVPAAKRQWGYYIYPLLEGERLVGRIELAADRPGSTLTLKKLWPEPGVSWNTKRCERLCQEIERFSRLAGLESVNVDPPACMTDAPVTNP